MDSHYEISPREREDEDRWYRHEFSAQEMKSEDERADIVHRTGTAKEPDAE